MTQGKNILTHYKKRWQFFRYLEVFLFAIGPTLFLYFLLSDEVYSVIGFAISALIAVLVIKPWKLNLPFISAYVDQKLDDAQHSTGLLLHSPEQLSPLARLQQHRISEELKIKLSKLKTHHHLPAAGICALTLALFGFLGVRFDVFSHFDFSNTDKTPSKDIIFKQVDSITTEFPKPVLTQQSAYIKYPAYAKVDAYSTTEINLRVLEGTTITWALEFDSPLANVHLEKEKDSLPMALKDLKYLHTQKVSSPFLYNFKYVDEHGRSFVSDLHSVEIIRDQDPVLEVTGIKQFTSYNFDEDKKLRFTTRISDDYGLDEVYIIATVSKGSGESVKFREERLDFETYVSGQKSVALTKTIDLDQIEMDPGDELYFYIAASDHKTPKANLSRSETYFAVIKDTTSFEFGVEGNLGVDLMPAYFRSQRQLIIDTEKLIADKVGMEEKTFNSTSNILGDDQKSLRLKYGQFMGDEAESGIQISEGISAENNADEEDSLAEYTHDHDGDNEHNLVADSHEHEEEGEEENEDPLEAYLHNHDDPEESTFFAQSLKNKLRQALNVMWDAELQLRLYKPEASLPYQYKALKLLQEIKNSARIYVHRIGFDPPPIKEDVRLSGELDAVVSYRKNKETEIPESYPNIRKAVSRLEQLINTTENISKEDRKLFEQAGNELAAIAIEEPGKYLETLQALKWLSEDEQMPSAVLRKIQNGLLLALPEPEANPTTREIQSGAIDQLLLKELEIYE
ncbi:tryptophan-rich sensory protein [Galbibacter sp. EGI 63066]|uniref:tryptophan-rich sensory protein n=1 Tax=Galbibacter sp. EGI 63066 TaxID=2993559 RepID=UPI0022499567|nr:tryptophan-rich sensory protein [Galbibacter sp. EGI 63066]MCX2678990.1 tryptophan-rich sensory protein [Galbibacter sp. EGI 63066]